MHASDDQQSAATDGPNGTAWRAGEGGYPPGYGEYHEPEQAPLTPDQQRIENLRALFDHLPQALAHLGQRFQHHAKHSRLYTKAYADGRQLGRGAPEPAARPAPQPSAKALLRQQRAAANRPPMLDLGGRVSLLAVAAQQGRALVERDHVSPITPPHVRLQQERDNEQR